MLNLSVFVIIVNVKKIYIKTYGCQMNVHETEKMYAAFEAVGYSRSEEADADVIIFNTCCVREGAETRVIGNLGQIKKLKQSKPSLVVAICGCMTQQRDVAETLHRRCPFVNIITGTYKLNQLPAMVKRVSDGEKFVLDLEVDDAVPSGVNEAVRGNSVNKFVNIMYGCNNFCTYCIVPYVKGRERSRPMTDIVCEVKTLVADGAKEVTLLGQNVNSYSDEYGHGFYDLLSELASIDGTFWIKFMTSHPKDLSVDVVKLIGREPTLANYIHLPLQSGSDDILRKMNRKYTSASYLSKIDAIREYIPEAGITSDIIVGFPTETEEDFQSTIDVVERVGYNNLFTFIYSKRNGTPAAVMEGQISDEIKKERISRLIKVQAQMSKKLANECVGKTYTALCDGHGKNATAKTQEDRVIVFDDGGEDFYGKFVNIGVTSAKNSKLYGKIRK